MSAAPKEQPLEKSARPAGGLWGGRFDRAPDELFYQFQRSFAFDRRLLPFELAVDRVWAGALESAGPSCKTGTHLLRATPVLLD